MSLTSMEAKILEAWRDRYNYGMTFDSVADETSIPRNKIRRFVRAVARKGYLVLTHFEDEYEGKLCGSGYVTTEAGDAWLKERFKENVQG